MGMNGKKHSEEAKKKMREAKLGKCEGENNSFFGKKHSNEAREKMRQAKLKNPTKHWKGKRRPDIGVLMRGRWKGDHESVAIATKHDRIRKMWGTPRICEICGTTEAKIYDWSNKDHLYRVDRDDWQRLCRQCHRQWDVQHNNYTTHTERSNKRRSDSMRLVWQNRKNGINKTSNYIKEKTITL